MAPPIGIKNAKVNRGGRRRLFGDPHILTFKADGRRANIYDRLAFKRGIPLAMWLREAAEEKAKREGR